MPWRRRRLAEKSDHRSNGTTATNHVSMRQEREILDALRALRSTTVRDVMTPRVDVTALRMPVAPADVALAVKESGHSRFPVYEDDLDNLRGVLFVKDLFRMSEQPTPELITRRLRKPFLVPESRPVLEVLQEMRQRRSAFAVVVDEYGGVEGVLTIKDLVSELVGELPDEFDAEAPITVTRVDSFRWLVDGQTAVDDVREELGVEIPDGSYVTLGGFLFDRFGRIPDEGDQTEHDGWRFRIVAMEGRRIVQVLVHAPETESDSPSDTIDPHHGK